MLEIPASTKPGSMVFFKHPDEAAYPNWFNTKLPSNWKGPPQRAKPPLFASSTSQRRVRTTLWGQSSSIGPPGFPAVTMGGVPPTLALVVLLLSRQKITSHLPCFLGAEYCPSKKGWLQVSWIPLLWIKATHFEAAAFVKSESHSWCFTLVMKHRYEGFQPLSLQ